MRGLTFLALALALAACAKPSDQAANASQGGQEQSAATPPAPPPLTAGQQTALLAELPPDFRTADLANGKAKFAICASCHTPVKGAGNLIGPNLWGVFGRKAGTEPGFAYSDGMRSLGIVWDADKIRQWIANPRAMIPGTKMIYFGMENPKDRTDVVAYLKTVTSPPPAS